MCIYLPHKFAAAKIVYYTQFKLTADHVALEIPAFTVRIPLKMIIECGNARPVWSIAHAQCMTFVLIDAAIKCVARLDHSGTEERPKRRPFCVVAIL